MSTSTSLAGGATRYGLPEGLTAVCGVAFLAAAIAGALTTGMSWDEFDHRRLGEMALDFYRTWGADRSATTDVMRYYGALHALVGAGFERLFAGLHWVAARHLASVFFAAIGFFYAVRLARLLAGRWAGAVTALLLLSMPRWVGHAMFNPIDVPTAGMFSAAFYYLVRLARELESAGRRQWLGFGVAAGLTLAVRLVGLLLVPYAAAVVGAWVLAHLGQRVRLRAALPRLLGGLALAGATCVVVSFAFWPRMLVEPLVGLKDSLGRTHQYPWPSSIFFRGEFLLANEIPRSYLPTWFTLTTPLATVLGCLFALVRGGLALRTRATRLPFVVALVLPLAFPPLYAVLVRAVVYDGVRHFLFLLPPLAALAAAGWVGAFEFLARRRAWFSAVPGVLLATLVYEPLSWTAHHLPLCYVYFQPLAGGLAAASHRYDTDYWSLSVREAAEWIVTHRREFAGEEPIRILVSSSWHLLSPWLDDPSSYISVLPDEPHHLLVVHSRWQSPGWESLLPHEASSGLVEGQVPFWQIYRGGLAPKPK